MPKLRKKKHYNPYMQDDFAYCDDDLNLDQSEGLEIPDPYCDEQ